MVVFQPHVVLRLFDQCVTLLGMVQAWITYTESVRYSSMTGSQTLKPDIFQLQLNGTKSLDIIYWSTKQDK